MPETVVSESHAFRDDYVVVPSLDDFEELNDKIASLKKSLSMLVSDTKLKNAVADFDVKISHMQIEFQEFTGSIAAALENGQWKQTFTDEVSNALSLLEKRYNEVNTEMSQKMALLAQMEEVDDKIKRIFMDQEKNIKSIIQTAGMQLKDELDQKLKNADILNVIKAESQTIRWE